MPGTNYHSAAPSTREEALEMARLFFEDADEATVAAAVEAMISPETEQAFAIMRGSGNEMDVFEQYVSLCVEAGLLDRRDAADVLMEYSDVRQGARP